MNKLVLKRLWNRVKEKLRSAFHKMLGNLGVSRLREMSLAFGPQ